MNLYSLSNALAHFMGDPPLPRVEYVERYVNTPNPHMLTKQEREWLREDAMNNELTTSHTTSEAL